MQVIYACSPLPTPQKDSHRYMSRRVVSEIGALVLIFDSAFEGDLGELSDEDQPCSAAD